MQRHLRTIGLTIVIAAAMCQVLFFILGWTHHNVLSIGCFLLVVTGVVLYAYGTKKGKAKIPGTNSHTSTDNNNQETENV